MKKLKRFLFPFVVILSLMLSSCGEEDTRSEEPVKAPTAEEADNVLDSEKQTAEKLEAAIQAPTVDLAEIPAYTGDIAYAIVNGNVPDFNDIDMITDSFEMYSDLDSLGRCGAAYANIGTDIMPTEERGSIGQVKPTGWHTVKYDNVDGKYLYNRCHLIGYQLTAENANEKNLITGTRYMNVEGMLPFENMVADYIKETDHHVLYRVSPVFEGDNLVAAGVQMEAKSVEDDGEGILFNVFCYNVQPDIYIDYATGESSLLSHEETGAVPASQIQEEPADESPAEVTVPEQQPAVLESTYILNTNTKKFHSPACRDVGKMKDTNKQEYTGNRDDIINQGYEPCKHCNP